MNCLRIHGESLICTDIIQDIFKRPDVKLCGFKYEIFETIGKVGNFTTNYQIEVKNRRITRNNRIEYPVVSIFEAAYSDKVLDVVHVTTSIFDIPFGIYVTPSEFYTNYEKLLLPFDVTTWILLLFTTKVIILVLFVTRFIPQKMESLFFGYGIRTPGLNVVYIFFGIGQTRLPRESISRFILTFFVLFCLIIRTCYQSKMFEFITNDMRKSPPKTLEEVIERKFSLIFENNIVFGDIFRKEIMS